MVSKDFEVDDLVWAKMKGFPPWPAKIAQPTDEVKPPNLKKPQHFVYFFGTHNVAWILDEHITPHSEEMLENTKTYKKRPATLQSAIEEIEKEDPGVVNKGTKTPSKEKESSPPKKSEATADKPKKTVSKIQTPKKTPAKKRPFSDVLSNDLTFGSSAKRPAMKKSPKKRALPLDFATSTSKNLELEDADRAGNFSQLTANLPPNNGYSKVAVIPPYNELAGGTPSAAQTARILDRHVYPRPQTPPLDIKKPTDNLVQKKIVATNKKIGFLGLGMMGRGMVKNLLNSHHKVTVWNRTEDKCKGFWDAGATRAATPSDVVAECDITFCCVSDPTVAKELVFGNCGVLHGLTEGSQGGRGAKGYVEMTSIDSVTSQEIAEAISDKGGRYLEAPVIGSRALAEEGSLLILGAGDRDLFDDCESCFFALSRMTYYLSCDVGSGSKMNLILSMLTGTAYAALAEAIALVERCKLSPENFLEILGMGPLSGSGLISKGQAMVANDYAIETALKHQQKDLGLALMIGNTHEQPLSVAAAANEIFKRAKLLSYAEHDVSAVHLGAKL